MGRSSVACSISNLSIEYGDEVYLLPLTPGFNKLREGHFLEPQSSLIYPTYHFTPFSLPILGYYDDYGRIDSIREDDNTEILEKFFETSINNIVRLLTNQRKISYSESEACKIYGRDREIVSGSQKLTSSWLIKFGFTKKDNHFVFEDDPGNNKVTLEKRTNSKQDDGYIFKIFNKKGKQIAENWCSWHSVDELQDEYLKATGFALNAKPEYRKPYNVIRKLSSMFIHKDIYDHMVSWRDPYGPNPWSPKENLAQEFDEFRAELISYDEQIEAWEKEPNKTWKERPNLFDDPMDSHGHKRNFASYIGNTEGSWWTPFRDLYRQAIKDGKLRQKLCDFIEFDSNLSECNRFYFPAMNGTQHGNASASIDLAKASLKVLGKRAALIAEENIVPEVLCKVCKETKDEYIDDFCKECHIHYYDW